MTTNIHANMSPSESPRFGWIGLGSMGLAMSINLQKHLAEKSLPALQYWNRTISRGDALKQIGGMPCESPETLVQNCDIVCISVRRHNQISVDACFLM
jgi:3-hydroxyisobutyrate dehydrogenase-like beta-hydroxyacid dehydrogenase